MTNDLRILLLPLSRPFCRTSVASSLLTLEFCWNSSNKTVLKNSSVHYIRSTRFSSVLMSIPLTPVFLVHKSLQNCLFLCGPYGIFLYGTDGVDLFLRCIQYLCSPKIFSFVFFPPSDQYGGLLTFSFESHPTKDNKNGGSRQFSTSASKITRECERPGCRSVISPSVQSTPTVFVGGTGKETENLDRVGSLLQIQIEDRRIYYYRSTAGLIRDYSVI